MLTHLTRSFQVILMPGAIVVAPWIYLVMSWLNLWRAYSTYELLFNLAFLALAIVVGAILFEHVSYIESDWDKERDSEFDIENNWLKFLSTPRDKMPVGFDYLGRLATRMMFALALSFSVPAAGLGGALIIYDRRNVQSVDYFNGSYTNWEYYSAIVIVISICAAAIKPLQAYARLTHETLNKRRAQIIALMDGAVERTSVNR